MSEYDFRTLSPADFEHLSRDVLNASLGLHLRSYPEGRDQGIDLREVAADGHTTIVQCKHYARSSTHTFLTAVRGEMRKPARRMADRYIFVTSHPLTAARETEVAELLAIPVADVWGPDALNAALAAHPAVERRHFKLWLSSTTALVSILRAGMWQRSDAMLADVAERARPWVRTGSYDKVLGILQDDGVCLVTGPHRIGKTVLAEMVALAAARGGWQVIQIAGGPPDAWAAWQPSARQLFFLDDFLTGERRPDDWLSLVAHVRRHRATTRLLLTCSDHALTRLAHTGIRQIPTHRLSPGSYTPEARTQILVNHVGPLPHLDAVTAHPAFSPGVVQGVADRHPTDPVEEILAALDAPRAVWEPAFGTLPHQARELLLTLATFPDGPVRHSHLRELVAPPGRSVLEWRSTLRLLEPLWITIDGLGPERRVAFAQTGCRGFLLSLLDEDPDLAEDRIAGIRHLDQLTALSRSAGLLPDAPPRPYHRLAATLLACRDDLAAFLSRSLETTRQPGALHDIALLLTHFGDQATNARMLALVAELRAEGALTTPPVPPAELLTLAAALIELPVPGSSAHERLPHTLVMSALEAAESPTDLDIYDTLPVALHTDALHASARRCAARILRTHAPTDPATRTDLRARYDLTDDLAA